MLACHLAVDAREVVCIESNRGAAQLGVLNARVNDVDERMHYVRVAGRGRAAGASAAAEMADLVILDPPRAGCSGRVTGWLALAGPERVVYVSCDPATLARDLHVLVASGPYRVEALDVVDMFPQTYHVESVVTLTRADGAPAASGAPRHRLSGTLRGPGGGSPRSGSVRLFAVHRPQPGGRVQGTSETGEEIETGGFVHLHTHSEFSLLDGMSRVSELVDSAKAMGQTAVAITDHGVLYGAVDFYSAARAAKINPIIGCEMYMAPRSRTDREGRADRDPNHLILLARNDVGYRNLIKLVSASHLEGYYYKPRIDKELLAEHAEGLICLSACLGGELPQAIVRGDMDAAESVARQHAEIFGPDNYFLELQDHGIPEEETVRAGLVEIARRTGLPLVATNDSHYIKPEDAEAHDILLCLQTGARREEEKRFRFSGPEYYLASTQQMRDRFAAYGEAVSNTVAIADRCHVEIPLGRNLLPTYSPIPEGLNADTYLLRAVRGGRAGALRRRR